MRFPPQFIDRLRHHFLISEVIGKRIALRRHGREFMGLCPFHQEKSPSFTVNDEKRFFHCFGCGAHGDAIGFLKDYEGLSYVEAVEKLAAEAGIALPEPTPEFAAAARRAASLYEVIEEACRWFEWQLTQGAGRVARDYVNERGLTEQTQKIFRLGFAPAAREGLKQALLLKKIPESAMVEAGLLIRPEGGGATYDRFRERLIFPIRDVQGRVIAFGGRILSSGDAAKKQAKYLNSPETPLFKKGEVLYNADLARKPAMEAQSAVVVEGYMDVIALYQAGIKYAVAPLGTAVTEAHLASLWRLSPEPVFCLDGDAAGLRAMARAAELALPQLKPGYSLRFVTLPGKEDPDSLIRHYGVAAMRQSLENARTLAQALWESVMGQQPLDTPERKAAAEQRLMQLAETINDKTVKSYYRSYFRERLWPPRLPGEGRKKASGAKEGAAALPLLAEDASLQRFERQLLKMLLLQPVLMAQSEVEEVFARIEFSNPLLDKLRQATLEVFGYSFAGGRAELHRHLAEKGFAESLSALLEDHSAALPGVFMLEDLPELQAVSVWRQALGAYTLARMETEYRQAVAEMAREMTEETLGRCQELQRQIAQARAEALAYPDN